MKKGIRKCIYTLTHSLYGWQIPCDDESNRSGNKLSEKCGVNFAFHMSWIFFFHLNFGCSVYNLAIELWVCICGTTLKIYMRCGWVWLIQCDEQKLYVFSVNESVCSVRTQLLIFFSLLIFSFFTSLMFISFLLFSFYILIFVFISSHFI